MADSKRLKILIFVETFSNPTETFVYNQVITMAKDHEVKVVCLKRLNESSFPFDHVQELPFAQSLLQRKSKALLRKWNWSLDFKNSTFAQQLNHSIQSFSPDIIHCHFGIQALYLTDNISLHNIPIFITFHGYDASKMLRESRIYRDRLRGLLRQAQIHSLFVSQALLNNLLSYDIHPAQQEVLYLGIDPVFFTRQIYPSQKPFTFLQVASFTEKKGQEYTLKAFAEFIKINPTFQGKLVLAGSGPLLQQIKDLAEKLGITAFLEFPGLVNREEVKALMEGAHVFLHHSITASDGNTEGLPTVIMEAMAMELPVISTLHAGIPELVEENVNGYLVKEKDTATYAAKMAAILGWSYLPENRQKVLQDFNNNNYLEKLAQRFQSVLSQDH